MSVNCFQRVTSYVMNIICMFLRKTFSVLPFESRQNKKWIMELALHFHKMTLVKVRKVSCFIKWKENTVRSLLNVVRGKKGNGKGQVVKKVCYLERKFLQQELSCSFIYLFIYLFIHRAKFVITYRMHRTYGAGIIVELHEGWLLKGLHELILRI